MRLVAAHGSSKPRGQCRRLKLFGTAAVGAGVALVAVSVYETGFMVVRLAAVRCGDRVFGDRFAGGGQPLLPFGGGCGLVVGEQEVVLAEWAAAVLGLEQPQRGPAQRGWVSAAPGVPVVGQGGVIR